ncbi:MAG: 3-phosphoshikimate 1-carboxyvinyltransferase [Thaumarchaeota archaeon]|nr:3-phosphoshikimate 1-carboxyvinyltransferase [Nitrososphaerota archaeon]
MPNTKTTVRVDRRLEGSVLVPPSKSYTHRAVLMASLSDGDSIVINPLISRDTSATLKACKAFGASISNNDGCLLIRGARPRTPEDVVNVENSGTTLRFMTSVFSLADVGNSILTGDASIRRRPMQPLLDALGQLGVEAWSSRGNGCAPLVVRGGGMRGGTTDVRGEISSQFVSSLLAAAPLAEEDVTVRVTDAVSKPYIDATLAVASRFGVTIRRENYSSFFARSGQTYRPCTFKVPGDLSSASFIAAAVAMAGGNVRLEGLDFALPQGDAIIVDILSSMGVTVKKSGNQILIDSDGGTLKGGAFDLVDTPDLLPVVTALSLKCGSTVEIGGVAHARFKETDRIGVLTSELKKLGANVEERDDGLAIKPAKLRPSTLNAHDDHRMFMAFSLASMLFPSGIPVVGVESLDVSYPSFLDDLRRLGVDVRSEEN